MNAQDNADPDDAQVTAERIGQLNDRFYSAEPADYLNTRLLNVLLLAGEVEAQRDLLRRGINFRGISFKIPEDEEFDQPSLDRYIISESQVLLHHGAEALLRLYLAHEANPECPWFELARARDFRRFKERVQQRLVETQRRGSLEQRVGWTLLGTTEAPPHADPDEWARATSNLTSFLRTLAERWLEDAPLYNSMKHGLGTIAGDASVQLQSGDGEPIIVGAGASVEFLESTAWLEGNREWKLTTRWVDIQESLGLVHVAASMIDSLWKLARWRYVDAEVDGGVYYPTDVRPLDLRAEGAPIRRFSLNLLRETRPPAA